MTSRLGLGLGLGFGFGFGFRLSAFGYPISSVKSMHPPAPARRPARHAAACKRAAAHRHSPTPPYAPARRRARARPGAFTSA
ncbi:hypothetical protein DM56_4219 [Burkholderia mallei]|nr:hypothetical protein DM56_4219 [Burkholderia mallei]